MNTASVVGLIISVVVIGCTVVGIAAFAVMVMMRDQVQDSAEGILS